ncbi:MULTISPECIES: DUF3122 domain-containing protein [unclassified Synechococcus]|uniref:DUF3122 domain-containing protein n=1 Tax=unclassified Synechococcus TaxID=2626047 RepID=UPI0021A9681D|nr:MULTISPECIES: DUF3122 domain-containing protein [unclassified Synechococcus]
MSAPLRPGPWRTLLVALLLSGLSLLIAPGGALAIGPLAQLHGHLDANGTPVLRSLESLRDLDDQSWQLVAYRAGGPGGSLRLRIVGYPGKVRLDHPTPLQVSSGPFQWNLEDITLASEALAGDGRSAAAEFDLAPLLADLSQDRPLRLRLKGVFSELPVPPYVVGEWRQLGEAPA